MTKNKMHNLFIGGKKAVLLAMFAALPIANINASEKQSVDQTVTTEQLKESENTWGPFYVYGVMVFLFGGVAVYFNIDNKGSISYKLKERFLTQRKCR